MKKCFIRSAHMPAEKEIHIQLHNNPQINHLQYDNKNGISLQNLIHFSGLGIIRDITSYLIDLECNIEKDL